MAVSRNIISMLGLLSLLALSTQSGSYLSTSNHFAHALFLFPTPSQSHPSSSAGNATSKVEISFSPWGGSANNMTITAIKNGSTLTIFKMNGNTGAKSAGFQSQILNYNGNYISLVVGNVSKTSDIPYQKEKYVQVYFNFYLAGKDRHPTSVSFVEGPIYGLKEGWNGNHFYKTISSHSQNVLNLNGSSVTKVSVDVQKEATVNLAEFGIGFH